ncbi:unnamed protein product [Peronospora belbahrii]|uniref:VPS9 domain-containing protein n=1 Tax=Peronospora belbahrii TaxID=622444 RepID=A0ABN8D2L1_9STRA|nr:unnamed protein product [Peronospora belbahrii]
MFWGLGGGEKSGTPSHTKAFDWSSQYNEIATVPTIPFASSYVLSKQRRDELLLAARSNRVSWIDGVENCTPRILPVVHSTEFSHTLVSSRLPIHCREALEGVNIELSKFLTSLEALKRQILVHDMHLIKDTSEAHDTAQKCTKKYHTLFQELQEQEPLVNLWQRSHTPWTRKLTGHDREMAFLLGFRELLALLKNAQAAELVYRIQSFVSKVELWDLPQMLKAVATKDRPGGKIQDFIKKLIEQIKHSKTLRLLLQGSTEDSETQDEQDHYLHVRDASGLDMLHEVLEAFLMEKVYVKTLTPSLQVAKQDDAFHDYLSLLDFITFEHLDLPVPQSHEHKQTWLRLARQLEAMTLCPSPRRKMDGVLRVCQDLTMFLKSQNGGRFPSADEFLPALIFIVLRANPCELKRNVAFILEYRNPTKLVSEPGYFFTHLISSVAFLEQVDCSRLTISAEEFEKGLDENKAKNKSR